MDHIGRIRSALDYIEAHLSEDISLEEIARQANSSFGGYGCVSTGR